MDIVYQPAVSACFCYIVVPDIAAVIQPFLSVVDDRYVQIGDLVLHFVCYFINGVEFFFVAAVRFVYKHFAGYAQHHACFGVVFVDFTYQFFVTVFELVYGDCPHGCRAACYNIFSPVGNVVGSEHNHDNVRLIARQARLNLIQSGSDRRVGYARI